MTQDDSEARSDPASAEDTAPVDLADTGSDPASLLGEARRLRRQARWTRHAYWLPLTLFGLLTLGSTPFYIAPQPGHAVYTSRWFDPLLGGFFVREPASLGRYWAAAIVVGLALTGLWYRRHGRRVGLVTPSRGFLVTSAVLLLIALLPLMFPTGPVAGVFFRVPADLIVRGTFPLLIIAVGLWVLAWAERSAGLAVICAIYTGTALLVSLYNVENVLFRLGWSPSGSQWRLTSLPNPLLAALVLLISGASAWFVQRRQRRQRGLA